MHTHPGTHIEAHTGTDTQRCRHTHRDAHRHTQVCTRGHRYRHTHRCMHIHRSTHTHSHTQNLTEKLARNMWAIFGLEKLTLANSMKSTGEEGSKEGVWGGRTAAILLQATTVGCVNSTEGSLVYMHWIDHTNQMLTELRIPLFGNLNNLCYSRASWYLSAFVDLQRRKWNDTVAVSCLSREKEFSSM